MTNIPQDILKAEDAHVLYSTRWQIELFFKILKGQLGLNNVMGKNSKRFRIETLIRTIIAMLICEIAKCETENELSLFKIAKIIRKNILDFLNLNNLANLVKQLLNFGKKDKNRNKKSSLDKVSGIILATNST